MKLIIDIPEEDYKRGTVMARAIRNGTPISDNATNGDVINTLFSDIGIIQTDLYTGIIEIDLDWWNAPYKGESNAE